MRLRRIGEWRLGRIAVAASMLFVVAALTQPLTGIPVLPDRTAAAFACPAPINLINGSFEMPVLPASNSTQVPGWVTFGNGAWAIPAGQVPGWTNSTPWFELWKSGASGVPAADGNQFAELNAFAASTVSQSIDTTALQGQTIEWRFWHRGRLGNDTMEIRIGPTGGVANFVRRFTTGNTAWVQYSGTYAVPIGQTSTQFAYLAVSAVGGIGAGNFLDGISFGTPPCATDLRVIKSVSPAVYVPGEQITFTITVTNDGAFLGQYDVVGATLSDAVPADVTGVTWTCTASAGSSCGEPSGAGNDIDTTYDILEGGTVIYMVTGTAPTSGSPTVVSNTATVAVPAGITDVDPANNTATAEIAIGEAELSLVKSADPITGLVVGEVITYTFSVTNPGTVDLTDVTVTDPLVGLSPIDCDGDNVIATLPVRANVECTATYTVTQADVDAGSITNTATATGVAPPGVPPPAPATASTTVPFTPDPSLAIAKTSDAQEPVSVGDVISYSYAVINDGNVTMTDVTVTDPHSGLSAIDCGGDGDNVIESMAPGGPVTCTATYTATQGDVDAGSIANTGSALGTPVNDPQLGIEVTDNLVIDTDDPAPALSLVKLASFTDPVELGDVITYGFEVANTGNVTLTDVRVVDPLPGLSPIDCGGGSDLVATLAPSDPSVTCTATYTVTQADVDAGGVTNTASATATPPPGSPPVPEVFSGDGVPIPRQPALTLVKAADPATATAAGEVITYTFSVTNTGNVTLTDVTVSDPLLDGSPIDCGDGTPVIATLTVGATPVTCTATYTVTQADVDAGGIDNTATATGTPPEGSAPLPPAESSAAVPIEPDPALSIDKTTDAVVPVGVGDVLSYGFTVDNLGNVTLTDITVIDPLAGLSPIDCGGGTNVIAALAPADPPVTCTATYTVTQADVDAGGVTNTATATGVPPNSQDTIPPTSDTNTVDAEQVVALELDKSADPATASAAGQLLTYTFTVTNVGTVTMTDVTVADPLVGLSPIDCGGDPDPAVIATLAPGATVTCTATYTVTQADLDDGAIDNTATAIGQPPPGVPPQAEPVEASANVPITVDPALAVVKTGSAPDPVAAGDVITYTFTVDNTGNVALTDVTVTDPLVGLSPIDCGGGTNVIATLAPADPPVTCSATYTVTQADVDASGVANTATATGTDPTGDPVSADGSATTPLTGAADIVLDKAVGGITDTDGNGVDPGDVITYTFVVTNAGTVTLDGITVNDPLLGGAVPCGSGPLSPGASRACQPVAYVLRESDLGATLANTATATATAGGQTLIASDTALTPMPPTCSIVTTTTSTSTTTTTTLLTTTSAPTTAAPTTAPSTSTTVPTGTEPPESSEAPIQSTEPAESAPQAESIASTSPGTTTPSSTTTSTTADSTGPAAPARFAATGYQRRTQQVDPCAMVATTTTTTTTTPPPAAGGGGGGGASDAGGSLPATGRSNDAGIAYAALLLTAGIVIVLVAQRRRQGRTP